MKKIPDVSADFDEGVYFDLWLVVHFLTGVTGGFVNVFFGLNVITVLIVGCLLMIAWEVGEKMAGIDEAPINRVVDVIIGLAGTALALWIASSLSPTEQRVAFFGTWGLALAGLGLGVRNARKRKREGRPRARRKRAKQK